MSKQPHRCQLPDQQESFSGIRGIRCYPSHLLQERKSAHEHINRYFQRIQEQIADFVTQNSGISREMFEQYMMATGEMATDVGTILYGKEAVSSGLIDELGGLSDALDALHSMIRKEKKKSEK